ncbi:MAG: hypothetical protein ABFQ95_08305 [Pseudomonadota bacterium]
MFCHFLFEPLYPEQQDEPVAEQEEEVDSHPVKIHFINATTPMVLQVEEDQSNPDDEDDWGAMEEFVFYALNVVSQKEWLNITDEDGETAFFRGADIAMVEIPLQIFSSED